VLDVLTWVSSRPVVYFSSHRHVHNSLDPPLSSFYTSSIVIEPSLLGSKPVAPPHLLG